MKELNWPTRLFILGTTGLTACLIAWQWHLQPPRLDTPERWAAAVIGIALVVLASVRPISLHRSAHLSLGSVFGLAAICLFEPVLGIFVFLIGLTLAYGVNQWQRHFFRWYQILFSIAAQTLSLGVGATLYVYLQRGEISPVVSWWNALWFAVGGAVFVLLNGLLVAIVVGLSERVNPLDVLLLNRQGSFLQYVSHVPLAGILIILYQSRPWAVLLILLPLVAIHLSLEEAALLRQHTQQTLQFVARLVDAREPFTARHSRQVTAYAAAIASAAQIPLSLQGTIRVAAALHDVGKLSIPESVLLKPSTLNEEEWQNVRTHPSVGASLVRQLPFLRDAEEIIRSHHEHYDGTGYPDGRCGEAIPLGARLLAIADALDAITADRPYRSGGTLDDALSEVQNHAGTQFDPHLVEAALLARPQLEQIYANAQGDEVAPASI